MRLIDGKQIKNNSIPIEKVIGLTTSSTIRYNNIRFVDVSYGDDGTATLGDPGKPYLTINASISDSSSGELIWINPGIYNVTANLIRNGVNIYCMPGVTITCISNVILFNGDTTSVAGVTLSTPWSLTGFPIINGGASGNPMLVTRLNPSADIYIEARSISWSNNSNCILPRDGITRIRSIGDITCVGRPLRIQDTANLYIKCDGDIYCTTNNASNATFYCTTGYNWTGTAIIEANSLHYNAGVSNGAVPIHLVGNSTGSRAIFKLKNVVDTANNGSSYIDLVSGGNSTSYIELDIDYFSSSYRPLFKSIHSNTTIKINKGYINGGTVSGTGKLMIYNSDITTSQPIRCASGILSIRNSTIDALTASSIIPIIVTGGTVSLMSTTLINDGTTYSINNISGSVLSEGSRGNSTASGSITGNFYINSSYII